MSTGSAEDPGDERDDVAPAPENAPESTSGSESAPAAESDLDADLRALFADARLDLRERPGARHSILLGARRRRRRRAVLAGGGATLAVASVATAVLTLQGFPSPERNTDAQLASSPSIGTAQSVRTSTAPARPEKTPSGSTGIRGHPVPDEHHSGSAPPGGPSEMHTVPPTVDGRALETPSVIRRDGYRSLELGMRYSEAAATGMLADSGKPPMPRSCRAYPLAEGRAAVGRVKISRARGVVEFTVTGARTDAGVGVGTPERRVRKAYPDGRRHGEEYVVGDTAGQFRFALSEGAVTSFRLIAPDSDC